MSSDGLRYNDIRQKSIHNAFQRHEGIPDQFLYWRVRSLEVDLHTADVFGSSTKGDWAVYHSWHDPMSTVARFSQFLQICRGLNRVVPRHEVMTLFIDIKDPFPTRSDANHSWKAFDALLDESLGSRLYRPRDLWHRAEGASGLRESIGLNDWPTLDELRGKFIAVLTGSREQLANYAKSASAALKRSAFLSTPVDSPGDIPGTSDTVFFNINGEEHLHLVDRVKPLGYVARAYYVNSQEMWRHAVGQDCHHIATDKVNERIDTWASTTNALGYPFERLDGKPVDSTEQGTVCGIWSRSDDLWSEADSFQFNYNQCQLSNVDNTYDFAIASANSHTEDFTKGAVLARAGLQPDDAYFAVVRTGQEHGLRAQFRPAKGDPTTSTSPPIGPSGLFGYDIDQDTLVHVRLKIDRDGKRARAWGSVDREQWIPLGRFTFDTPLRFQGIGVSSHRQRRGAKFLFVPPRADAEPMFEHSALIDAGAHDYTGWVDWNGSGRWLTTKFSTYTGSAT